MNGSMSDDAKKELRAAALAILTSSGPLLVAWGIDTIKEKRKAKETKTDTDK
jgi:hypothetical protein